MGKNKFKLIAIAIPIIAGLAYFQISEKRKYTQKIFNIFYNDNLNGRITEIRGSAGITYFRLDNKDGEVYGLAAIANTVEHTSFSSIARVGDSVAKPSKSDTIKVLKNGRVYAFTFHKFKYDNNK